MFTLFGFLDFHILDLIDISVVSYLFYRLFVIVQDMKAAPIFFGLLLVVISSLIAAWLELEAILWIIDAIKTIWVIAFLIIFQPELRRALSKLGQSRWFRFLNKSDETKTIDILVNTANNLAKKELGGLIVIAQDASLDSIIESGTRINSIITEHLIETIFTPPSPLHDGAIIIKDDMIVAAGCILPITQKQNLDRRLGLRHRAAIGISEDSDAIVVVISEETSYISVAKDGVLLRNLTDEELKNELTIERIGNLTPNKDAKK